MSLLDNVNDVWTKARVEAKKKYDTTRLDMRIRAYAKEETELYAKAGKLLYAELRANVANANLLSMFESIDAIKGRIRDLDRQKAELNKPQATVAEEEAANAAFHSLNKKDGDFVLARTSEGIRLVRVKSASGGGTDDGEVDN